MAGFKHEDTIGEIEHEGKTYQIDWPNDLEDESEKADFATIYFEGGQVDEFYPAGFRWESNEDVMEDAQEYIGSSEFEG